MSWDVRSNMKAQPGSQGTLFQGGSDQMTDAKWPRHYTPERLHQVREAVAPRQRVFRDEPYMMEFDTAGETRKLIDTVARSTVPAEHLQRLQFSPGKLASHMTLGKGDAQMTAGGIYNKPQSPNPNHFGMIRVRRGDADHPVAIHEIGHHASHLAGTASYGTHAQMGHEEGKADAYAEEHFRDRRGRPTSVEGYRYMRTDSVRNEEFFNAYHAHRDYRSGGPTLPTPRPPGAPNPRPPLPGLDALTIARAQPKGTLGNRGFK